MGPGWPAQQPSLGVTAAVHAATSLRAAVPPSVASAPLPHGTALPPGAIALPPAAAVKADMFDVIAARRSKRRFSTTPLPLEALAGALGAMTVRGEPILSTAVRIDDVIGDAAAVFVLSMDRAVFAADPLGPARGYRHAFLEAGFVGERIYLDAVPRGLGVCAVGAFYDDEATKLVRVDPEREWVIHFAALGVPSD
jgi:hypothetical protein